MGVLAADAADCRCYLSESLLKTSRHLHRLPTTRVEDGREVATQRPVFLSP